MCGGEKKRGEKKKEKGNYMDEKNNNKAPLLFVLATFQF